MSVDGIKLRNFRGFREATIELKPLTVLLGPNSAGKSAFGHASAALSHAHHLFRRTLEISLTPDPNQADAWPIDLGKTADLRKTGTDGCVWISLKTSGGWIEYGFGLQPTMDDLCLSHISYPRGEPEDVSSPSGKRPSVRLEAVEGAQSDIDVSSSTFDVPVGPDADNSRIEVRRLNESQWQERGVEAFVPMEGLVPKEVRHVEGTARVLSGKAREDLKAFLDGLTYLRATRRRPSRIYQYRRGKGKGLGYGGEWTPSVLLEEEDRYVTYANPPAVPRSADEVLDSGYNWGSKREPLGEAVGNWLAKLGLAQAVKSRQSAHDPQLLEVRVNRADQGSRNITEIGFGVSQILPVLVAGLLQQDSSMFVVDLPEAHLHPRPQAELADFFCSLALSGRSCLVETHSEMFFHRLRLRAEMTAELLDKIAVYFIDEPSGGDCSEPRIVGLRSDREPEWPAGFFHEGWEAAVQIGTVRRGRKSRTG